MTKEIEKFTRMKKLEDIPTVVMDAFNSSTREVGRSLEFKNTLVYIAGSRKARTRQRNKNNQTN